MTTEAEFYEHETWGDGRFLDSGVFRLRLRGTAELIASPGAKWLDMGTGDGVFLDELITAIGGEHGLVVALDRSEVALSHVDGVAVRASSSNLPFRDGAFDLVTAFEVLEHLPVADFESTRHELARVAADRVVITVPNREKRNRGAVTCQSCGCRYNPFRHLRSFRQDRLDGLIPNHDLAHALEFGHRAFVYPRFVRRSLEMLRLLERPGNPICPQCGQQLLTTSKSTAGESPTASESTTPGSSSVNRSQLRSVVCRMSRKLSPRSKHRYYLGAEFVKRHSRS